MLRPVEGDDRYFVYTRWDSEESFQSWVQSQAFAHGHAKAEYFSAGIEGALILVAAIHTEQRLRGA